jgi:hypothetical protein
MSFIAMRENPWYRDPMKKPGIAGLHVDRNLRLAANGGR